ncbi:trifunctional MMPL family transporter/lysophospholipid acyltransferase/class I SAM-dependent methyltransferase [Labilibaculum antarcticum]|uniref:SSD domain-containing protein n=1 Tax=Labilibaculum antarcticum TaxID=1717717 RepID=A0A1Y1CPR5_9BACT|nr:trifunctional MMPL family transporter/lysophospholipid acyltransferase/class I SAM-dependent methyltransferase [Labilibaculum antarcticum]BAX82449.1 hypothetical protein ALGA_4158 [Labilibaculum antarcticum]
MGTFFWSIFLFIKRFRIVSSIAVAVLLAFLWLGTSKIHFEEDISKVLMSSGETKVVNQLMENIDFSNKIVLIVSQKDTLLAPNYDSLIVTATRFVESMNPADSLIKKMSLGLGKDKVSQAYDVFYRNLPLFLEKEDYEVIAKRIDESSIKNTIEGNFKALMTPAGIGMRSYILNDPLHFTPLVLEKLKRLQLGDAYKLYQNYLFSDNGYHLFFFMESAFASSDTGNNALLVENIARAKTEVDNAICTLDYYGAPVVAVCNAIQIKRDILLTVSLALVLLILLISLLFRSWRIFILVFLPVVFGISVSLGCFYWVKGSISAIALGVGSILMGITIDYTLHAYVNFRSKRSVKGLLDTLSQPLLISGVTTSIAFLCLYFVDSPALQELGVFAALSIISAVLFVLIITPQFLESESTAKKVNEIPFLDKITAIEFDKFKLTKWIILACTIASIFTSSRVVFNTDLNALNYQTEYLKNTEQKLKEISSVAFRSVFFVVGGESVDAALTKFETYTAVIDSLQTQGVIRNISSPGSILKSKKEQQIRLDRWNSFWTENTKKNSIRLVKEAGAQNHFKPEAFSSFENILAKEYTYLSESDQEFIIDGLFSSLLKKKKDKVYLLNTLRVDQKDKKSLYSTIETDNDAVLWDKQYFSNHLVDTLKDDFSRLVWISLFAVFFVLLISYGRFELAIIAMIPLLLSWLWTLGLMGLFGIEFNIFNIIISTFIFGLGVDYAVFILNALIENRKYGTNELKSAKLSILLSAITTFAGIGVLIFAKHPALQSIAALSIIGIGSILFLSFTLLPLCYRFLYFTNGKERTSPVIISNLFSSVFALIQFVTGCLALTSLIPVLLILPIRMKTKKYIFHSLVQFCSKFIVYSIFGIKKRFINREKFDLSTPKLIVSNHQSHLDLVLLFMLHPKIVVITNNWVWNNPFYGFIVKFLDFHPTSKGMEEVVEPLQKCVDNGYSVLIFPEGRRTRDGEIARFHNGAAFLAEKLSLDVLPVLIHGANHCMDRNEFFLKNGQITLQFFDLIKKEEFSKTITYVQRSKQLCSFFRSEFDRMRQELETPDYFANKLVQAYIYKGPVLEWYLRVKMRLEHNYNFFDKTIPREAVVCDIGCGYGFLAAMLKFVSPKREIYALDYDEKKIKLAAQAHAKIEGLQFEICDISKVDPPKADAYILNDVLHYMPESLQSVCIKKCMQNLKPGGQIIIRDADTDLEKRTKGTKLTELFSTKLLHFNKTKYKNLFFFSGTRIEKIAGENGFEFEIFDQSRYTSNIIYKLKRKTGI